MVIGGEGTDTKSGHLDFSFHHASLLSPTLSSPKSLLLEHGSKNHVFKYFPNAVTFGWCLRRYEMSIGGDDSPRVFKPKPFCNSLLTRNLLLFLAGTDSIYKSWKVEMEKAIVS